MRGLFNVAYCAPSSLSRSAYSSIQGEAQVLSRHGHESRADALRNMCSNIMPSCSYSQLVWSPVVRSGNASRSIPAYNDFPSPGLCNVAIYCRITTEGLVIVVPLPRSGTSPKTIRRHARQSGSVEVVLETQEHADKDFFGIIIRCPCMDRYRL